MSYTTTSKKVPNCFILYRNKMMQYKPPAITMREYNKALTEQWKAMSEDEKSLYKRKDELFKYRNSNINNDFSVAF